MYRSRSDRVHCIQNCIQKHLPWCNCKAKYHDYNPSSYFQTDLNTVVNKCYKPREPWNIGQCKHGSLHSFALLIRCMSMPNIMTLWSLRNWPKHTHSHKHAERVSRKHSFALQRCAEMSNMSVICSRTLRCLESLA